MSTSKVRRSQVATFMNITPDTAAATYAIVGDGVSSGEISYSPETESVVYIHQDSGSTDLTAYKPNMSLEATAIAGNPVFDFVDNLRINRAVLDAAKTDIVNVWLYKTATEGAYPAEKQDAIIAIDSFGGEGGKPVKIKYTINYQGNPVKGTFNPTTKAFTPAA